MDKKTKEEKNEEYLKDLLSKDDKKKPIDSSNKTLIDLTYDAPSVEYTSISIKSLPSGRFYRVGTKLSIRASKVSEIQAYSMTNDDNFVEITEKMNELLSKNIIFIHPDGSKGDYRDIKDSDRIFLIFMIRELTFQGGNTLTKEVMCGHCDTEFKIPFRSTHGTDSPATFDLHIPNEKIEKFYNKDEQAYEIIHKGVSWKMAPPTIGIQEDFYEEIKRNVQSDKKPDVAFMKIVPFLLYDKSSVSEEGIKAKQKEFKDMNDLILFQGLNTIVSNMTIGIKGLKMECPSCSTEVYTDLTFPSGASTLFELPNILDQFGR